MTKRLIVTLDEVDGDDLHLVGGKALTLALLKRNGLSIPVGLIITSTFFEAQINHLAYRPIWAGSPDVAVTEASLAFLADHLKRTPLAPDLARMLRARLNETFGPEISSFAVRSSAIDEDSQDHSFAGTHLTELGVPRDILMVGITRCWSSALAGKAVRYRLERGLSIQSIRIAVLIQPMLPPDIAGVAFTLNPISGARDEFVVEAVQGPGESVTSSAVTPYRYHLSRQPTTYPVLKKIPGDTINLTREPLASHQLVTLAKTLEQVEAMLGRPQDVEWLFNGGQLYLLQSRPITSISERQPHFTDHEWMRISYPELLPETPSPLVMTLLDRLQENGHRLLTALGFDVTGVNVYLKSIYGRLYINASILRRVSTQLGLRPNSLFWLVGYFDSDEPASTSLRINWSVVWQSRHIYLKLCREALGLGRAIGQYTSTIFQIVKRLEKAPVDASDRLGQFKQREQIFGRLIVIHLLISAIVSGILIALSKVIAQFTSAPDHVIRALASVTFTSPAPKAIQQLAKLGRAASKQPVVLAYLVQQQTTYLDYERALVGTQFLAEFQAYLARYGNRAIYDLDISFPRYGERPDTLLRRIRQYAVSTASEDPIAPPITLAEMVQTFRVLVNEVGQPRRGFLGYWVFIYPLLWLLNKIYTLRDRLLATQASGIAAIRSWDLAQAAMWVKAGYLNSIDDYFWLSMAEIERTLVAEQEAGMYLNPAVAVKREHQRRYTNMKLPMLLKDSEMPRLAMTQAQSLDISLPTLIGLPVSSGQVQGVVKFLEPMDMPEHMPPEVILVAPSIDLELHPFFSCVAGLIVEVGGLLSHGSIIAREYGIPAVSNIVDARQRLKPGDRVLLDGSTGIVQILQR